MHFKCMSQHLYFIKIAFAKEIDANQLREVNKTKTKIFI